jgi:hypothetical protein
MTATLQNILTFLAAGALLVAALVVLRFVLKLTWKIVRVALVLLSLLLLAGYFLGYIDIILQ